MAEKGSAVAGKEGDVNQDEGRSFEDIFNEELGKSDETGDSGEGGKGADGGAGDEGAGKKAETGSQGEPPDTSGQDAGANGDAGASGTGSDEGGQETELSDADRQFLTALQYSQDEIAEVTPNELARLRRTHSRFDSALKTAEGKAKFFGESNKKLSDQFKKVKSAYKEIMGQQTPADRIAGVVKKLDISKLSQEAQNLLKDPAYMEAQTALLSAIMPKEDPIPGVNLDEEDPPEGTDPGTGQPAAADKGRQQQQQQPPMTEEQQKEYMAETIQMVTASPLIQKNHPDIRQVYSDPAFQKWTDNLSDIEVAKLFSRDPRAHNEVLNRYKAEKAAADSEAEEEARKKPAVDGLRTHQSGSAPTKAKSLSNPDADMDDKEFDEIGNAVRSSRVRVR